MCLTLLTWISFTVDVARNRFIVIGFDCCFRFFLAFSFLFSFCLFASFAFLLTSLLAFIFLASYFLAFSSSLAFLLTSLSAFLFKKKSLFYFVPLYILIKFLYVLITIDSCFGYQFSPRCHWFAETRAKMEDCCPGMRNFSLSEQKTPHTKKSVVGGVGKWPWFRYSACVSGSWLVYGIRIKKSLVNAPLTLARE